CAVCGGRFWAHEECENGHYVCDACHSAAGEDVLDLLCSSTEKSPSTLMETLWKRSDIHLFGPEHHWLVPCVLLVCYRNCGGKLPEDAVLTAFRRGRKVVGGSCGYWGACGAAIGLGIYFSILLGATPVNSEVWRIPQRITAECLEAIASLGGARCCKRTCRLAVDTAVKYTAENFGIELPVSWSPCGYAMRNSICLRKKCPYYIKSEVKRGIYD
ncbi:MAG: hypothetical protein HUJ66_00190, partial [Oscillospiraceae bacterium]|nr:hypothetical protein [Oscillospiraceae bacterium]